MNSRFELTALGWDSRWEAEFHAHQLAGLRPGRVAIEHRGAFVLYGGHGEVWAEASGKLRHEAASPTDLPTVGDWVAYKPAVGTGRATIVTPLLRRTYFARKTAGVETVEQILAANIDTVFLMSGLDGDFNLRRIERYLTLAWSSGAQPVIVLNKADLHAVPQSFEAAVAEVAIGVPIHIISAASGQGLEELAAYGTGNKTIALLGSSGVGKSSLLNALAGSTTQRVQELREDGRGRHTTTHRQLVILPEGGLVIDTPGMRELQLWGDEESLQEAFEDISDLARACRFRDCRHDREPGCAVNTAVEDGTLSVARLDSYRRLQKELRFLSRKQDRLKANKEKKRASSRRMRRPEAGWSLERAGE